MKARAKPKRPKISRADALEELLRRDRIEANTMIAMHLDRIDKLESTIKECYEQRGIQGAKILRLEGELTARRRRHK
jgi:sugar-specific transcriptional regulator TrmB